MSGTLNSARFVHAWTRRSQTREVRDLARNKDARDQTCPACASLAPRMRVNTREWVHTSVLSLVGRRIARTSVVWFATDVVGFVAGMAVESAVKHICAGSSHAKRESNRIAHWRRAIVTR